jgi:hypothetical protein
MTPVPLRGLKRFDWRSEMEDTRAAVDFPLPAADVTMTYNGIVRIDVLEVSERNLHLYR